MTSKIFDKLVNSYNDLVSEVEKLILRSVDEQSTTREKFKKKTKELQCPVIANISTLQEKMMQAVNFFKNVRLEGKSTNVSVPPLVMPPKARRRQSMPGKLTKDRLTLDISRTVIATNKQDFNAACGRAIPLCLPNDCEWDKKSNTCKKNKSVTRDTLVINPEAKKILESITGPISVVAIVGPCRTGKSYILSRLISSTQYEEPRFKLGHLMDPETMGIWMWDTPIQFHLKNGEEVTIILLDTEGIDAYNADKRGDTQIFTLSVLLSSLLIYNSTQVPRREDLNQMTFIANLAKSIGSRGSKMLSRQEIKQIAPSFLWLLRDAILEPVNAEEKPCHFRDYLLEKVLRSPDIDGFQFEDTPSIQAQASKCLLEFFVSLDAEMIPPPSTNSHVMANIEDPRYKEEISPDFLHQVEYVRRKILDKCQPKRGYTEGSLMNGIQFTGILGVYVDALNSPEGIPKVGSAWEQVMKNTYQIATNRAIEEYKSNMATLKFPIEDNDVQMHHRMCYEKAVKLFEQQTKLDSDGDAHFEHLEKLSVTIASYSDGTSECNGGLLYYFCEQNKQVSEKECQALLQKLRDVHLNPILENLSHETNTIDIVNAIEAIQDNYYEQSKGPARECAFTDFMKNLEEDRKQFTAQLSRMKDYDNQLQIKSEELQEQKSIYEQQEEEKKDLETKLHSNAIKIQAIQQKMASTEKRFKDEAEQKQREHSQQISNLEQAKMKIQSLLEEHERTAQKSASDLRNTIASLQQSQNQLQTKLSAIQNSLSQQPAPARQRRKKKCILQ